MADDNFDPKKIIEALRAKGIPDSEIKKLYPNYDFGEEKKKSQQRQQKTKKPKEPKEPKKTWSTTNNERLKKMFANGYSPEELANEFGTSPKQILDQVEKLKKNGWDGATPITPEQRLANKRKFERLRNITGKTGKTIGKGIYKGASKLNEHFGGAAAANIEKNFGLLGRGFNRLTGLGYSKIDEEALKGKLKKEESGGGVSVEALNKTTAIIIGSISNLNHSISHGTSLLGRVIGKATSKVIDKISNIESIVKKLNYTKIIRQRKEDILGGGNGLSGGKSSFAKMALVGGIALASGMALNSLLPEDSKTDETPPDAEKKPELESKKNSNIGTKNDGSSEELRIKASEIKFNAKDIEFEYDKLVMEGRDFTQNQNKKGNGGASGSWSDSQQENATDTKSDKTDSVFPNPDTSNPQTQLGGFVPPDQNQIKSGEAVANLNPSDRDITQVARSSFGSPSAEPSIDLSDGKSRPFTNSLNDSSPAWLKSGNYDNKQPIQNTSEGLYRKPYALSEDTDLSDRVISMIAGESYTNNQKSVDAVINTALNRVGTKMYGKSSNLLDVATARGQFIGNRKPSAKEAEFIRSRIRAIASGREPDITNGSNEFRTTGSVNQWNQRHPDAFRIGGNNFARNPANSATGPYAPYSVIGKPKIDGTIFDKGTDPLRGTYTNDPSLAPFEYKPVMLDPSIKKGSKLNDLEIENQTQPPAKVPEKQSKSNSEQSNQFTENDKTHFENVLETQGPNHFAESGFPDGNLGILS